MSIQILRGTTASLQNTVLKDGQIGYSTNDSLVKIGDGSTSYKNLDPINKYRKYSIVIGNREMGDTEQTCDYLCPGDGAANDAPPILNAIASLGTRGGTIFVRRGTYYINNQVNILGSNIKIIGDYGTIFEMSMSTSSLYIPPISNNIDIENIKFNLNSTSSSSAIDIQCDFVRIDGCIFTSTSTNTQYAISSTGSYTTINSCEFYNCYSTTNINTSGEFLSIINCLFHETQGKTNGFDYALISVGGRGAIVTGNHFKNCALSTGGSILRIINSGTGIISNNNFFNCGNTDVDSTNMIYVTTYDTIINQNIFYQCATHFICRIAGNTSQVNNNFFNVLNNGHTVNAIDLSGHFCQACNNILYSDGAITNIVNNTGGSNVIINNSYNN